MSWGGGGGPGGALPELSVSSPAAGEAIETGQPASLVLGVGVPFGKEFEAALSGARQGDRKAVEVEYQEDAPNKKYAGKKVSFDVAVSAVRGKRLPEVDEDFVKNFGDIKSLEAA